MKKYSIHIGLPEIGFNCHHELKKIYAKYNRTYISRNPDVYDEIISRSNIAEARNFYNFFKNRSYQSFLLNTTETCTFHHLEQTIKEVCNDTEIEKLIITYNGTGISFKYPFSTNAIDELSNEKGNNELILLYDNVFWDKNFSDSIKINHPNLEIFFIFDCCSGGGMGMNLSEVSLTQMRDIIPDSKSKAVNDIINNYNFELWKFDKHSNDLPDNLKNNDSKWITIGACPQKSFTTPGSKLRHQFLEYLNSSISEKNISNLIGFLVDKRETLGLITFNIDEETLNKPLTI